MGHEVDLDELSKKCRLLNNAEIYSARQPTGIRWSNFPIAKLVLTMERFDFDCFIWESYTFVSSRLRTAMALPPAAVQYFDVDDSRCSPQIQTNAYKIMNVTVMEDAIDVSSSGLVMGRLAKDSPEIVTGHGNLHFRQNFHPTYEMFCDRAVLGHDFCTDSLALRVLNAGCTGVRFFDAERFQPASRAPFRTLRGVERTGAWDPIHRTLDTELIEPIT